MIQENELITFLLCFAPLIFIIINYSKWKTFPGSYIFIISFVLFTIGWFFTVIEGIILGVLFNIIEHLCYISSSILLLVWAIIYYKRRSRNGLSNRDI